jgi:hypothetical protein
MRDRVEIQHDIRGGHDGGAGNSIPSAAKSVGNYIGTYLKYLPPSGGFLAGFHGPHGAPASIGPGRFWPGKFPLTGG